MDKYIKRENNRRNDVKYDSQRAVFRQTGSCLGGRLFLGLGVGGEGGCGYLTSGNKSSILLPMETAVVVDVNILNEAMQVAIGQTQRQIVENALKLFAVQNRQIEARKYRGKLQWEGNLDELRTAKWSL